VCYSSLLKRLSSASKIPFMRVVMCTATSAMVMDMSLLLPHSSEHCPMFWTWADGSGSVAVAKSRGTVTSLGATSPSSTSWNSGRHKVFVGGALRVLVTSRAAPPGFVVLGVPVRLMGLSLSTGVATIAASFLQDVDSRSCDTPFGSVWDLLNIVFTDGACVVVVLAGVVLNRARRDVFVGLSRCIGVG